MTFHSRQDAGRRLGEHLATKGVAIDLVLGLPRGGVIVAAEVAARLNCEFDVLVVRKIGHPHFREFAVGALSEPDVIVLDERVLRQGQVDRRDLDDIIAEERRRLSEYQQRFTRAHRPSIEAKAVAVVDDGLATGATLEAAIRSVRHQRARWIVGCVPVASRDGASRIATLCDEFHALMTDPTFQAVGQYYDSFAQVTDDEVAAILGI